MIFFSTMGKMEIFHISLLNGTSKHFISSSLFTKSSHWCPMLPVQELFLDTSTLKFHLEMLLKGSSSFTRPLLIAEERQWKLSRYLHSWDKVTQKSLLSSTGSACSQPLSNNPGDCRMDSLEISTKCRHCVDTEICRAWLVAPYQLSCGNPRANASPATNAKQFDLPWPSFIVSPLGMRQIIPADSSALTFDLNWYLNKISRCLSLFSLPLKGICVMVLLVKASSV